MLDVTDRVDDSLTGPVNSPCNENMEARKHIHIVIIICWICVVESLSRQMSPWTTEEKVNSSRIHTTKSSCTWISPSSGDIVMMAGINNSGGNYITCYTTSVTTPGCGKSGAGFWWGDDRTWESVASRLITRRFRRLVPCPVDRSRMRQPQPRLNLVLSLAQLSPNNKLATW